MVVQHVELLHHSSSVLASLLSSGYYLRGVLHVGFFIMLRFLPTSQKHSMSYSELLLNCPQHCAQHFKDRLWIHPDLPKQLLKINVQKTWFIFHKKKKILGREEQNVIKSQGIFHHRISPVDK